MNKLLHTLKLHSGKILGTLALCAIALFIYKGFHKERYKVVSCDSTVAKYITAEFSHTESGIDFDGDYYSETEYWSERASETNRVQATNEVITSYPVQPEYDLSFKTMPDFDRYKLHTDTNLTVTSVKGEDYKVFNESINKAAACISKLDRNIWVKQWYSMTYGGEF